MEKIAEITEASFRTGMGKGGQPWTLMKIRTDSGKEASCFAPAGIGDPVTLEYNDQYKSYSARVVNASKIEQVIEKEKQAEKLDEILEKLDAILSIIDSGRPSGLEKARATAEALRPEPKEDPDEVVTGEITDEGEINLDDIPF